MTDEIDALPKEAVQSVEDKIEDLETQYYTLSDKLIAGIQEADPDFFQQAEALEDDEQKEKLNRALQIAVGYSSIETEEDAGYLNLLSQPLREFVTKNKEEINQSRELGEEIRATKEKEAEKLEIQLATELEDISSHFKWESILDTSEEEKNAYAIFNALAELTTLQNSLRNISDIYKEDKFRYLKQRISEAEKLRELSQENNLLSKEETIKPEVSEEQYENSLGVFRKRDETEKKIKAIEEYQSLLGVYDTYEKTSVTKYTGAKYRDDNGVPVQLSEDKVATYLVAQRIERESKSINLAEYFPEDEITPEQTEEYIEIVNEKLGKYAKLGIPMHTGQGLRLHETLINISNNQGQLPEVLMSNPELLKIAIRDLESEEDALSEEIKETLPKRYETLEDLPPYIELKSYVIFPEQQTLEYENTPWITANTTSDYTTESGEPFVQPVTMGNWQTKSARSVLKKTQEGYIQYKGTGNPEKPNFPPRVNSGTRDAGHEVLWAVGRKEAMRSIAVMEMLEEYNVPHTKIVKVVKLTEVPVPLNDQGGVEVRPFVDAYTRPWEHSDHVRRREIQEMRARLVNNHHMKPEDNISDEDIVTTFFNKEGFYQIHSEKPVAFKNDIAGLIESPILLDYLAGEEKTDLRSQAEKVLWIAQDLGRAYQIPELANLQIPDGFTLEDYMQQIEIVPEEKKHVGYGQMAGARSNQMSERSARSIRRTFNIEQNEKLVQVDGRRLYADLISTLPQETQEIFRKKVSEDQRRIVDAYVNSTTRGLGLSQAGNAKDSILGEVSDYWLVGSYSGVLELSDEGIIENLKKGQDSLETSWFSLEELKGGITTTGENLYAVHQQFRKTIAEKSKRTPLNITSGEDKTREAIRDKLIELHQQHLDLQARARVSFQETGSIELAMKADEYPEFIKNLTYQK